jgi:hypothetical protein
MYVYIQSFLKKKNPLCLVVKPLAVCFTLHVIFFRLHSFQVGGTCYLIGIVLSHAMEWAWPILPKNGTTLECHELIMIDVSFTHNVALSSHAKSVELS